MASDLSIQGEVVVSAEKAEAAFARVGQQADAMASKVAASANKAGQAVDGIGDGADKGAQKFTRSQARVLAEIEKSTRALENLGKTASQRIEAKLTLTGWDRSAFEPALAKLREAEESTKRLALSSKDANESFVALARTGMQAVVGSAILATVKSVGQALFEASAQAERFRTTLNFATGGRGAQEIDYLRRVTQELGLQFSSTAQAYSGFQAAARGTALEGQKAKDVFESIAKASAVMGLSAEQSGGVLLALQQMISKGSVQAEELRGQLGERLPGSFQIAAKAMGVTTAELGKMLEQGEVVADDFLPKFAKALEENLGGAAEQAASRLDAAVNRFDSAWERLKQNAGDSGSSNFIADQMNSAAGALDYVSVAMERVRKDGGGFTQQMLAAAGAMHDMTLVGKRTEQNMYDNAKATKEAEAKLAELQKRAATEGTSAWLLKEIGQTNRYIATLQQARRERDALEGKGGSNEAPGGDPYNSGSQYGEWKKNEADRAANEKKLTEERMRALGVSKQYNESLQVYADALRLGNMEMPEYIKAVSDLATRTYKASTAGKDAAAALRSTGKAAKESGDAFAAQRDAAKTWAATLQKAEQGIAGVENKTLGLNAAQALLVEYLKSPAYQQNTEEMRQMALARLYAWDAAIKHADATKEEQRALEAADKAIGNWTDARQKDAAALDAQLQAMREEVAAIGLTSEAVAELTAKKIDLAAATEEEYAANLKAASAYAGEYKTAYEQAARDAEERAKKLREKAGLERSKGAKKAAKEAEDAWNKSAQDIERALTDSLFRAFESGKDFGETLRDSLKAMFNTLVLRPIISAIVQPVGNLISSVVGGFMGGGPGGSMGGVGGLGGAMSAISSLSTAYNVFTNGLTSTLAGGIGQLGSLFGSQALTSFAAGMKGATLAPGLMGPTTMGATGAMGAGQAFAGAMPYLAGAGIGYGLGSLISNGYSAIGKGGYAANVGGTAIGMILGGPVGAIIGGIAGGVVNRLFGRKLKDVGIQGTFGGETGFEGNTFQFYKGGWFRSDKTKLGDLDEDTRSGLAATYADMKRGTIELAQAMSLGVEGLDGFTTAFKVSLKGLSDEDAQKAIAEELKKVADRLAEQVIGSWQEAAEGQAAGYKPSDFAREGETASETLSRLGGSLIAANQQFEMLGRALFEASEQGGAYASALADEFGGLQQMGQATAEYFSRYYSGAEQVQYALGQMGKAFDELGVAAPITREAFRELVEAQDLTTESGRETYAALIAMAPAFDQLADSLYALIGVDPKGIIDTLAKGILSGDMSGAGKQISNMLIGGIQNAMATAAATQIYNIANQYLIQPLLNAIITGQSIEELLLTGTFEEGVGKMETFADNLATALNDPRIAKGLEAIGKIGPMLANALTPVAQAQSKLPGASGGFTGITIAAPVTYQALPQYSSTDIAEMRYSPRQAVTADMEYTGHTRDTQILYARWKEIERDSEKALKESLRTAGLSPISQQMEDFRAQRIAEYQEGSWEYRRAWWQHRDAQYGAMDARERLQAFQNNGSYQTLGNPNIQGSSYEIAKYADHLIDGLLSGIDMSLFSEAQQAAMRLQAYNDVLAQLQESVQTLTSEEEKYLALMQQLPPELQKVLEAEEKRLAGEQRISLQRELDELMLTSAQLRERERDAIHESNLALYDTIQLARTQKALAEELPDLLYKLATPEQRRAMDYDRIAAGLGEAGISITGEQLASASMDQIVAAATAIYQMGETSDETRLALVRAVSGLKDLHDAAKDGQSALNAQAAAARTAAAAANKALGARNNAGSLLDQIDQAMGGKGDRYSRIREAELWAAMQTASYQHQIELSGELTGLILDRYQLEQDAARQQLDYAKQLKDYVAGLQIGNLSPNTLREKLAEAGRQYQDTLGLAQAGDKDAQGRLQGASNAYLELARQYYASGADYTAIFESVTGSLSGLGDSLMTDAERQLSVSNASLDELKKLTGVLEGAYAAAQQDYLAQQSLLSGQLAALQAIEGGAELARDIVQGLPALLATQLQQQSQAAAGVIETALTNPIEIKPAGEDVPTTIVTPAPIDWSGYQQGNDALVAEIKALREEVKVLREERLTADGQRSELDVAIATEHARRIVDGVGNAVQQGIYQASVTQGATYK